jgi:hypothetical protein
MIWYNQRIWLLFLISELEVPPRLGGSRLSYKPAGGGRLGHREESVSTLQPRWMEVWRKAPPRVPGFSKSRAGPLAYEVGLGVLNLINGDR